MVALSHIYHPSHPLLYSSLFSIFIYIVRKCIHFKAGVYGILVCGIRNCRVWYGPLPLLICQILDFLTTMIIFNYTIFMLFLITLARFMFLIVWKRMRVMNDNLVVKIAMIWAIFMSIWSAFTLFINRSVNKRGQMCSGIFSDDKMIKDWQTLVQPKPKNVPDLFLWTCLLVTVALMISMKVKHFYNSIRRPKAKFVRMFSFQKDLNKGIGIQEPKTFESMLLNFVLMILIASNASGYFLIWQK